MKGTYYDGSSEWWDRLRSEQRVMGYIKMRAGKDEDRLRWEQKKMGSGCDVTD